MKSEDDVKELIVQNVSSKYLQIAAKLGWNENKLENTTAQLSNNDSKLAAIIAAETTKSGKRKALEKVLTACRDLDAAGFILESISRSNEISRSNGSNESRGDYFQVYAASTSAAFPRHMMTVKQHLFGNYFYHNILIGYHTS